MATPLIIIGAPRSGTNMLRDALCRLANFATWDCDEINYIWRHGNRDHPSDAIPADAVTPEIQTFVRRQFGRIAKGLTSDSSQPNWVVEKTCANSLRIPFVDRCLPDAKYIFLVRDGRDSVASAMKRWQSTPDTRYLLRKARHIPACDLLHYGVHYLTNLTHRLVSSEKRFSTWGPMTEKLRALAIDSPLHHICAQQWQMCVELAGSDLSSLDRKKTWMVRYEDLVRSPHHAFVALFDFLETDLNSESLDQLSHGLSTDSIGRWRSDLPEHIAREVEEEIAETLVQHGYLVSRSQSKDCQPFAA